MLIGAAIVTLGLNNAQFLAGIESSKGAFGSLKAMGPLALAAVATGAVAAGIAVTKMAGNFESTTETLVTGAGEQAKNLGMVRQGILGVADATGTMTGPLVSGMFMIESSGQHGAQALQTLLDVSEGAKVGMASLSDVANGVTTEMTDYASSHLTAAAATNTLIAAVSLGKTHMGDLSAAMSTILPTSSAVHVSLTDTAAAMATMTSEGTGAASAATYLKQLLLALEAPASKGASALKAIGLTAGQVASDMSKSLPGTLQLITSRLAATYGEGSPKYIAALKDIAGGSRQMQGILELTGTHLKTFKDDVTSIAGAVTKGGNSIIGWSQVQGTFNQKLDQAKAVVETVAIKIGTALLPALGNLLGALPNVVSYVSNFKEHANVLVPILAGIGTVLLAVLVPAVWSLAAGVIAATWPLLLIGAVVAGLVAIFMHFYQTNSGFKAFIDNLVVGFKQVASYVIANFIPAMKAIGTFFMNTILPVLQQIGAFLLSTFAPVWQQLVHTWQDELLPNLKQLWAALQPLLPVLKLIGGIILGIVIVALGMLVATLAGLIRAFAVVLHDVISFVSGIIQAITGLVQIFSGVFQLLYDLSTGNFKKIGSDIQLIWTGIKNFFGGIFQAIGSLFHAVFGGLYAFISGWVEAIIGFFEHLYIALVGGSIIPDMINGIIRWFAGLPGRVFAFVSNLVLGVINFFLRLAQQAGAAIQRFVLMSVSLFVSLASQLIARAASLVAGVIGWLLQLPGRAAGAMASLASTVLGALSRLAGQALSAGARIVQNIASGILGSIGSAIGGAMSAVGSFIHDHLPHSPAKLGPLRDLPMQSALISQQIAAGIIAGSPKIQAAMSQSLHPIALSMGSIGVSGTDSSVGISSTSGASGGTREIHLHLEVNGREFSHAIVNDMGDALVKHMRVRTGMRG